MDRLAALRDFVAKSPDDPFPRYGLAMELANRGQLDEACHAFQELLDRKPDYVPAYLMYGNALVRAGQRDRAAEVYRSGAEVSLRCGDTHAHGEILAALAALEGSD
jgi:predicted Zn-dependent protease